MTSNEDKPLPLRPDGEPHRPDRDEKTEQAVRDTVSENPDQTQPPPPSPPPARGPRLKILALLAALCLVMLWAGANWSDALSGAVERIVTALQPAEPEGQETDQAAVQYYTCGMHPWVILPKPGDCPICHMTLTPLDPSKFTGEISIDPVVVQNIGVRVKPIGEGPLIRTVRTVGNVAYDERTLRDVNLKVEGWIENLYVDYAGTEVKEGDPLFDLFSRDLYSAQEEYLLALRGEKQKGVAFMPRVTDDNKRQVEAARTRLELFGISAAQIEEIEKTGHGSQTMTIRSPHSGIVTEKHAFEGMFATPGMVVYRIADLSHVWVMVTLYEYQLPYVELGQKAIISLPYIPGQTFEGQVTYIYPWLDPKTREVQVRLEFDNPNLFLKPGMFANVELRSRLAERRTLAPQAAIINTGDRSVAFVSLGRGKFEPRQVRTGVETEDGMVEIIDGLRPGELVVTSGQFLIDSEAKMREALSKMIKGDLASDQQAVSAGSGPSQLDRLPPEISQALESLIEAYLRIGRALSDDTLETTEEDMHIIATQIDLLLSQEVPEHPQFWRQHTEAATIRDKAHEMARTADVAAAREPFADISVALSKLLHATGVPPSHGAPVVELHCPMFRQGQGGSIWLQDQGDVRNPFLGSAMLECFDSSTAIPVTGGNGEQTGGESTTSPDSATGASDAAPPEGASAPGAGEQPPPPPPETQEQIDRLVASYLEIQEALTRDTIEGLEEKLAVIREASRTLAEGNSPAPAALAGKIAGALPAQVGEIDHLRVAFKPLSQAVIALVEQFPPSRDVAPLLRQAYCPMAKATWLQVSSSVMNPYYGESMLTCGTIQQTLSAHTADGR